MLTNAWEVFDGFYGSESEQVAHCFLEIASIYTKKKEFEEAVSF